MVKRFGLVMVGLKLDSSRKIVPVLGTLVRDLRNLFGQREIDSTLENRLKVKKTLMIRDRASLTFLTGRGLI